MKKLFKIMAICLMTVISVGLFTACGPKSDPIPENAKYINNNAELIQAINEQQDNEYWVLKAGTYDIDPSQTTIEYDGQTGWYLPIVKKGITIRGKGEVVLTSTHESVNGAWASQNFITVFNDSVTIRDIKVVCKKDVNKAVEILGENTTLKNVTFDAPNGYNFAGSIYLNQNAKGKENVGTLTLENVSLNKGRITASGANAGKIVFKNVNIDWTGIVADLFE